MQEEKDLPHHQQVVLPSVLLATTIEAATIHLVDVALVMEHHQISILTNPIQTQITMTTRKNWDLTSTSTSSSSSHMALATTARKVILPMPTLYQLMEELEEITIIQIIVVVDTKRLIIIIIIQ